jgi:hypothetical protein
MPKANFYAALFVLAIAVFTFLRGDGVFVAGLWITLALVVGFRETLIAQGDRRIRERDGE